MTDKSVCELRKTPVKSLLLGTVSDMITDLRHKESFEVTEHGKTFKYDKYHNLKNGKKNKRKASCAKNQKR